MPTNTLTYNLPDEQDDFVLALYAPVAWAALRDVDTLLRNVTKHDVDAVDMCREARDRIADALIKVEP